MSEALRLLLWGALGVAALQAAFWLWHLRKDNASLVDVGWALGLGGLAGFYALAASGDPARRLLVGVMGGLWGLRLGLHLWVRVARDPHEDGRYQDLRRRWGGAIRAKFFAFFQAQAALTALFSLPFYAVARNPTAQPSVALLAGVAVWALSVAGETLADLQLARFRRNPAQRGRTCREGLWRWSRHPNYFFEWTHWFAYVLLALGSPLAWLAWLGPVLMLASLCWVTGIPYVEAQALRSRGDDYRAYQRSTSAFIPWFPKGRSP